MLGAHKNGKGDKMAELNVIVHRKKESATTKTSLLKILQ
jgi:hypothetical protein